MSPKGLPAGSQVVAHFAKKKFAEHIDCELDDPVAGNDDVVDATSSGRAEVIRPTRLVVREPRKVKGEQAVGLTAGVDQRRTSRAGSTEPGAGISGSAVAYSIRPFADAFVSMTTDQRRAAPIELPGVGDADRYQFAFKALPRWSIERLPRRRIFHAPLRWAGSPERHDDGFHIELYGGGGYDRATRRFTQPWMVVVDHSEWSSQRSAQLVAEFDQAVSTARDAGRVPTVYALADQDPTDPARLLVSARAHIAILG